MIAAPVLETTLPNLTLHRRGKVRDLYRLPEGLLIVTTDRISAFDVILPNAIPDKGAVLTQLSLFWFNRFRDVVPNHVLAADAQAFPDAVRAHHSLLAGRAILVREVSPLPIECVARGYLAGSGWKEYQQTGSICGISLPAGLRESDRFPEPIFTPATKAQSGHDVNISAEEAARLVGQELLEEIRTLTLTLYSRAVDYAKGRGIIIADTKFEFGLDHRRKTPPQLVLIDEVLTPDSSRFWPAEQYTPGGPQPSFDKQFVRNYLEHIQWNKQPPAPSLPDEVVDQTRARYLEAHRLLTGRELHDQVGLAEGRSVAC